MLLLSPPNKTKLISPICSEPGSTSGFSFRSCHSSGELLRLVKSKLPKLLSWIPLVNVQTNRRKQRLGEPGPHSDRRPPFGDPAGGRGGDQDQQCHHRNIRSQHQYKLFTIIVKEVCRIKIVFCSNHLLQVRDGEVGVNLADGAWHTVKIIIMITILLFDTIIIMIIIIIMINCRCEWELPRNILPFVFLLMLPQVS